MTFNEMTFSDLSEFCRLCLMPLNGSYIDCALSDHAELKDTIKMVYNVDIQTKDDYSTKVCPVCCDILLVNSIHYMRVVESQKSLSRIQRMTNILRSVGKKKANKKEPKKTSTVAVIPNDVEMIEIEENCPKTVPSDDYEMKESYECSETITSQHVPCANESYQQQPPPPPPPQQQQLLFGNLTSFALNQHPQQQQQQHQQHQQPQWPTINDDDDYEDGGRPNNNAVVDWPDEMDNGFDINDVLIVPPPKPGIDHNNNDCTAANEEHHPSFFQLAKKIYGNLRNMSITNVERILDEITKQMALLRFTPC